MRIKVQHRDPNQIMKLSRLGCFHQSKLSFLRSFIREFKDWEFKNELFELTGISVNEKDINSAVHNLNLLLSLIHI